MDAADERTCLRSEDETEFQRLWMEEKWKRGMGRREGIKDYVDGGKVEDRAREEMSREGRIREDGKERRM